MYWMVTNRNVKSDGLGPEESTLSFWTSEAKGEFNNLAQWSRRTRTEFVRLLSAETSQFPVLDDAGHEDQQHLGIFVHGFNNDWLAAANRYRGISDTIYKGLGLCVLFTWPSDGSPLGYLPDRVDARRSADDLADILSTLYDVSVRQQSLAAKTPDKACRAKISLIAHSMGNFLLQKAMKVLWTRKNQPLLVSLLNQLLMVAADVDNDLFGCGEMVDKSDGDAIANLCYRITALYSKRDAVLGLSAGVKHFGKRRLGRTGLDAGANGRLPDNVWDVDCTDLLNVPVPETHSAYFDQQVTIDLMRQILRGEDRTLIAKALSTLHS
jgi:esterase/lipase superfamily enzyme